jgi:carbon-monoxide dehydrogenase medium subunit
MSMRIKPFHHHRPQSVVEACTLLAELGPSARVLAGGTDLLVKMKQGLAAPEHLVNIKGLDELDGVRPTGTGVVLGALTRLADIAAGDQIDARLTVLAQAAAGIGSSQIRNLATLGGNLCNASPAADMCPILLALEATLTIAGPGGSRETPLERFFSGPGQVDLTAGELVTAVTVPWPAPRRRSIYLKHGPRKAMDCAQVGVAVSLEFDAETGCGGNARVAMGAVAPTPVRLRAVEDLLEGRRAGDIPPADLAGAVQQGIAPISDLRASAEYRRDVAAALTRRAVDALLNGKEGEQ